jgi:hypothetical protein
MTQQPFEKRVTPISAPDEYILPARAEAGPTQDAFRQTQFLLSAELDLFHRAMNLQLRIAKETFPFSRNRTHDLTAIAGLWSRTYLYLSDALLLTMRGSYAATLPLVRTAAECIAAQEGLRAGEITLYRQWLSTTLQPDDRFKAFEFELGRYFSGETLASDATLRAIYRPAAELGRPNFGATMLQSGPESNMRMVQMAFADTTFHQGFTELTAGWLIALAGRQLRVLVEAEDIVPVKPEARAEYETLQAEIDVSLSRDDRCRIEEVMDGNVRRYVVHNFRRQGSGSPKKLIL